jgi:hypothetical protein
VSHATNSYHRIAFFSSIEQYVQENGEWFRDDEKSQPTLTSAVNAFLESQHVQPVFASAPNIVVIARTEDGLRQTQRATASVIYTSPEVVINGQEDVPSQDSGLPAGIEEVTRAVAEQLTKALAKPRQYGSLPPGVMLGGGAS